jgi:glutathione synthase/RimK-type ligase-like ATP-grasp enzyme
VVGASGDGVELVHLTRSGGLTGLGALRAGPVLVQEYAPEIARAGEVAGVFFDGAFSHGLRRIPSAGEFRVNAQYGGTTEPCSLRERAVAAMAAAIGFLPARPVYARVDGVEREDALVVMEVEVNEPGLGLDLVPGAAERFAAALERTLPK